MVHAFVTKLRFALLLTGLFAFLSTGLSMGFGQRALAASDCDPTTEQQVSIGFPGAIPRGESYCVPLNKGSSNILDNPIITLLRGIMIFLAAGTGLAVVGGIVYGGIVYMTARANPGQIQKAEGIIRSAIIGLFLYFFAFAIMNFLVPGGLFV